MPEDFVLDYITIPYPIYKDDRLEGVDRVIYGIIYFYVHAKNRKCFASNENLAKAAGVKERTVRSALTRLEDCGYIRRTYKDEGRRHRVEIEALVSFKAFVDGSLEPSRRRQNVGLDGSLEPHKKNTKKNIKNTASQSDDKLIAEVIFLFEKVNPSFKKWYGNTTQRAACDRMLVTHGMEKVGKVIALLPKTNGQPFFPTITTPVQLEDKWASLESALVRKKAEITSKAPVFGL